MKLIYIGLRTNRKFNESLEQERAAFWKSFFYLDVVRSCLLSMKNGGIKKAEDANMFLQSIIKGLEGEPKDKNASTTKIKLQQLITSIEKMGNQPGGGLNYIGKMLEIELQNYWLAWKEDFVCRLIEDACHNAYRTVCNDKKERAYKGQYLIVAALPEFLFSNDLGQDYTPFSQQPLMGFLPFHQEVALHFSQGALPTDNPGRGPGPERHIRLMRFQDPRFQLMIFSGTIIWQANQRNDVCIYNTAFVFYNADMVFAWDKQLVSDVDGASSIGIWRRHETINDPDKSVQIAREHYSASALTTMFMEKPDAIGLMPSFKVKVSGQELTFALTICREMVRDDLLQALSCDIHVVLACGIYPPAHIQHIRAKKAFLYCDAALPGGGPCVAAIEKGEEGFWSERERRSGQCQWQTIESDVIVDRWDEKNAFSLEYEEPMLIWFRYMEI